MTDQCKKPGDLDVKVGFPGRTFCPFSDVGYSRSSVSVVLQFTEHSVW